ncbi:MAG: OmcA/MtrC family decaheme c-type cytochrome [Betaproteobacteria bacterium]
MKRTLVQLGLVAAIISTLAGCGGGGGSDGAPGATGATGATGAAATATGVTVPAGTALVSTSTAVAFASNATPASSESLAAWKALEPTIAVTSISIASPPVVKFTVRDAAGKAVIGLGSKSQSSTATVAALTNLGFTLAKLVPGTNGAPSKWVSYNVIRPLTVAEKAGTLATASCNADKTWCGTYPALDNQGTLVDNGDGSYQYTFYRDPKQAATIVASLIDSADGLSKKADLGDLTFDATLTHRLGIQIGGSAPGSGTNTPTAVASNAAPVAVAMVNTGNQWYDFRPDGAAVSTTRTVVNLSSCADCHDGKVLAHGSRKDPNFCVTCHTDQIRYSFSMEAPATGLTLTGGVTGSTQQKRAEQAVIDGRAVGNYPNMIHKVHMGDELLKQGYNFNANGGAMLFNANGFPQDRRNCTKCHNGDTPTSPLQAVQTANGNNWKNVPSRLACGACHDGINFATGLGTKLNGAATGHGTGGVGGAQADDSACVTCHTASAIALVHRTNVPTANNPVVAAGVATISYEISSVTVNTSKQAVIKFRILKDGTPATLNIPTLVTNAATGQQVVSPAYEPITGFANGPSFYVAYAVPQDGITSPADFNIYQSVSLTNVLIASGSPKAGITTGPDASGYYTTTITGDLVGQPATATCLQNTGNSAITGNCVNKTPIVIPTTAKLVTGAMIGTFVQKGLAQKAYTAANVSVNPNVAATGGVVIKSMIAKATASGYTARRVIVDVSKCNSCHDQLGAVNTAAGASAAQAIGADAFHGGARNDPTACAICHNTTRTSTGWSANVSTYIHGIHGKSKRSVIYNWAAAGTAGATFDANVYTTLYSFTTPGVLQDCAQCHVPNAVNYGTLGTTVPLANVLWTTVGTNSISSAGALTKYSATSVSKSPYVDTVTNYGNNFTYIPEGAVVGAYIDAAGTKVAQHLAGAGGETVAASPATLVSSPVSAACFSCHDTTTARGHMTLYGGNIYTARSTVGAANLASNPETCLICHGAGKVNDAAIIHHK